MLNYYVCKILQKPGIVIADTIIYGSVEIRPARKEDATEMAILTESVNSANPKPDVEVEIACRIGTVVEANSIEDAEVLADQRFVEVLDLITVEYTMSQLSLAQCGYIKNLDTGEYHNITRPIFNVGTLFITNEGSMPRANAAQIILQRSGDLIDRYKRSIHWSRNAQREKSVHINLLYRWFAVEALFKEHETDDVTGPLMLFLGFPGSVYSKHISRELLSKLSTNESYSKWKRQMKDVVDKIRNFRNASVHSGFRSIDCSPDDLRLYGRLMTVGLSRCQGAAQTAILYGMSSVSEFKEYAGLLFENRDNVEKDIIGTIIHILDHDHLRHVQPTHF